MSDLCTEDGAQRLATRIKDFWRKRGYDVSFETHREGFISTMRSARTDLRSDMVNGMPSRLAEAELH
ncbi:MAG: phosphoglycolate phosphatase [Pseudomonadota bacterium]